MKKSWPFKFNTLECGAGGNCLFYCCARAISMHFEKYQDVSMIDIRNMLASTININNVSTFINKTREDNHDFMPAGTYKISSKLTQTLNPTERVKHIRKIVSTVGLAYQGSDITIRWLLTYSKWIRNNKIGFVILSSFGPAFTTVFDVPGENSSYYIMLFNSANSHWQLATFPDQCGASMIDSHAWHKYFDLLQV